MNLKYLNKIDTIASGLSFICVKFCIITEVSLADTEFVKNFMLQFLSNNTGKTRSDSLFHLLSGQWFKLCFSPCRKIVWSMLIYILRIRGQGGSLKHYKLHTPQYNLNIYSNSNIQDQ